MAAGVSSAIDRQKIVLVVLEVCTLPAVTSLLLAD
jgi:hypothetical protein